MKNRFQFTATIATLVLALSLSACKQSTQGGSSDEASGITASGQLDSGPGPIKPTGQPLDMPLSVDLIGERVQVLWTGIFRNGEKAASESWWLAEVVNVLPNEGKLKIHYIGWSVEWDEIVEADRVLTNPPEE